MKKFLKTLMLTIFTLTIALSASGCFVLHIKEPEKEEYETEYTFDETHHWFKSLENSGKKKDYAEHVNPKSGTSVGRCECGYYFPCHNLMYRKVTIDGVVGYEVYDYDEDMSPNFYHVEIPESYQGLSVISVADFALSSYNENGVIGKCDIKLESIKLNEGLLRIGDGAFCYSNIEEMIIPNSVKGNLVYTVMYCSGLKRVVVGNGVEKITSYVFTGCSILEELVIGNSVTEITPRNFLYVKNLNKVVLPASLTSIPETSFEGNTGEPEPQFKLFADCAPDLFLNITSEELEALTIPRKLRDESGNIINEEDKAITKDRYVDGWSGSSKIYFKGEWHYDQNGDPVPFMGVGGENADDNVEDDGMFDDVV